LVAV
jgi:hypothetical protein